MREIKFRAWGRDYDTDNVIMTKPFDFKQYVTFNEGAQSRLYPLVGDDVVFMQYTGLKDKNGVEIYEGDVVEWQGFKKAVNWSVLLGCWMYGKGLNFNQAMADRCEVIGNIYENPELLEPNNA